MPFAGAELCPKSNKRRPWGRTHDFVQESLFDFGHAFQRRDPTLDLSRTIGLVAQQPCTMFYCLAEQGFPAVVRPGLEKTQKFLRF